MGNFALAIDKPPKKETTFIIQESRMSPANENGIATNFPKKPKIPVVNPRNIDHGTTGNTKIFVTREITEASPIL